MSRKTQRVILACSLLLVGAPRTGSTSLQEEGIALGSWIVQRGTPKVDIAGAVMRLSGRQGWLRSRTEFGDFTLRFLFRQLGEGGEAALLVRAWVRDAGGQALTGYRIAIRDSTTGADPAHMVKGYSHAVHPIEVVGSTTGRAPSPSEAWHEYSVRVEGNRLTVALDGTTISIVEGTEPPAGYIGFERSRGVIELRDIRVTPTPVDPACNADALSETGQVLRAGTVGVSLPRVLREVRPRYSIEAEHGRIQGSAWLDVVVLESGSVGRVCITRSVHSDLDVESIAAAKQWQFTPARLDGKPVPVRVTIELTFSLR